MKWDERSLERIRRRSSGSDIRAFSLWINHLFVRLRPLICLLSLFYCLPLTLSRSHFTPSLSCFCFLTLLEFFFLFSARRHASFSLRLSCLCVIVSAETVAKKKKERTTANLVGFTLYTSAVHFYAEKMENPWRKVVIRAREKQVEGGLKGLAEICGSGLAVTVWYLYQPFQPTDALWNEGCSTNDNISYTFALISWPLCKK